VLQLCCLALPRLQLPPKDQKAFLQFKKEQDELRKQEDLKR
jgi:hypothetical protein